MSEPKKTIKQLSGELDQALAWFESDEIELDLSIKQYRLAKNLLKQIAQRLDDIENQIIKL